MALRHAQAHQRIDARLRRQGVRRRLRNPSFRKQQTVQFVNKTRVQLREGAVETCVERCRLFLRELIAIDSFKKVSRLVGLYFSAHQFTVLHQFAYVHRTDVHEQTHVCFATMVRRYEAFVQFLQLPVLRLHLSAATRQPFVLLVAENSHCQQHQRQKTNHRKHTSHDALLMRQRLLIGCGNDRQYARNLEHTQSVVVESGILHRAIDVACRTVGILLVLLIQICRELLQRKILLQRACYVRDSRFNNVLFISLRVAQLAIIACYAVCCRGMHTTVYPAVQQSLCVELQHSLAHGVGEESNFAAKIGMQSHILAACGFHRELQILELLLMVIVHELRLLAERFPIVVQPRARIVIVLF